MWIVGHAQVGWFLGRAGNLDRRDRRLVTWCGVVPDLDAVTLLGGVETYLSGHHVYLHNLPAALLIAVGAALFARRKAATFLLALPAVLLHFLSDGLGYLELRPLWPFSRLIWWPNGGHHWVAFLGELVVPALLMWWSVRVFRTDRISFLEAISPRLDAWIERRLLRYALEIEAADATPSKGPGVSRPMALAQEVFSDAVLYLTVSAVGYAVLHLYDVASWQAAAAVAVLPFVTIRWLLPWLVMRFLRAYALALLRDDREKLPQQER